MLTAAATTTRARGKAPGQRTRHRQLSSVRRLPTLHIHYKTLSPSSASRVYASRAPQKPFRGTVAQRGRERHRNARAAPPKREARQRLQTQCKLSTRPLRARSNAARSATRTHCTSPRITRRRALAPRAPPPCTNEGGSAASAAQAGHHAARKVLSHLPVVLIALSPLLADDARVHRAELPHRDSWEGRQGGACAQGARRLRTGLFCQFFFNSTLSPTGTGTEGAWDGLLRTCSRCTRAAQRCRWKITASVRWAACGSGRGSWTAGRAALRPGSCATGLAPGRSQARDEGFFQIEYNSEFGNHRG